MKNTNKKAFTLAEVLVTLGIIGVVAVLTVPNVISSYQKKVYVVQLQKAYNQLQQVFSLAMAEDEVEYLADTELMQSINGNFSPSRDQSEFFLNLSKFMKIRKYCTFQDIEGVCKLPEYIAFGRSNVDPMMTRSHRVILNDGMIISFPPSFTKTLSSTSKVIKFKCNSDILEQSCLYHGTIVVDINGVKKPNESGRDVFEFAVNSKGEVYGLGSEQIMDESSTWKSMIYNCDDNISFARFCAGRIFDEGWQMNY